MLTCPSCGRDNEQHFKFCLGCGTELPSNPAMPTPTTRGWTDSAPIQVAPALLEAQAASAPASARACPKCGNVVPVSFTFCGQCGSRLDAPMPTIHGLPGDGVHEGTLVLVRADGTEGGTHRLILGENLIGRGQGSLFDADGYLSPRHATISLSSKGGIVTDTDSLNGVFIRTTSEEPLEHGEVFRVGQELLRYEALPPVEALEDGTHIMGSPAGNAWGRLVLIVSREQDGSAFPLTGDSVVLGRERGDIVFSEDGYVSGTHARISFRNGHAYLTDLNSSNGTFIRLRGPRPLEPGSFLLMGQQLFRVQYA